MEHTKGHTGGKWIWVGSSLISKAEGRRDYVVIENGYVDNDDDARLIAAVPDFLSICKDIVALDKNDGFSNPYLVYLLTEKARQAIEGKQE